MLVVSFDHYLQFSYSSICYTNWVFANAFAGLSAKWYGHVWPPASLCSSMVVLACVISFQCLGVNTEGTKGTSKSSLLVVPMMKWKPKTKAFLIMCLEGRGGTIRETT